MKSPWPASKINFVPSAEKMILAVASFVSYSYSYDVAIFGTLGALTVLCAAAGRAYKNRMNGTFAPVVVALIVFYFVIPDEMNEIVAVAIRIVLVTVLVGLTLLPYPVGFAKRALVAGILAIFTIQVVHLIATYRRINATFADYEQCLNAVPDVAGLVVRIDPPSARFGRIMPAQLFDAYRYAKIGQPPMAGFAGAVGPYRPLEYRDPRYSRGYLEVGEDQMREYFTNKYWIDVTGLVVVMGGVAESTRRMAFEYGFRELFSLSKFTVLAKVKPVFAPPRRQRLEEHDFRHGNPYSYLLTYGPVDPRIDGRSAPLVCRHGPVSVYGPVSVAAVCGSCCSGDL